MSMQEHDFGAADPDDQDDKPEGFGKADIASYVFRFVGGARKRTLRALERNSFELRSELRARPELALSIAARINEVILDLEQLREFCLGVRATMLRGKQDV